MHEYISAIIHAALLTLGIITPLGMQNIFVFNQGASHHNFRGAMPAIVTAAACDSFLISAAILGMSLIILEHIWFKLTLFSIGLCFLLYMGFNTWRSTTIEFSNKLQPYSSKKQILFGLSVSLLNPHAIIDTVIVIGTNATAYHDGVQWVYGLSAIVVTIIWFISLAYAGYHIRRLNKGDFWVRNINRLSSIIIFCVAGYIAIKLWEAFQLLQL